MAASVQRRSAGTSTLLTCRLRTPCALQFSNGSLSALPLLIDGYTPDLARTPDLLLALSRDTDWGDEKACFRSVAEVGGCFSARQALRRTAGLVQCPSTTTGLCPQMRACPSPRQGCAAANLQALADLYAVHPLPAAAEAAPAAGQHVHPAELQQEAAVQQARSSKPVDDTAPAADDQQEPADAMDVDSIDEAAAAAERSGGASEQLPDEAPGQQAGQQQQDDAVGPSPADLAADPLAVHRDMSTREWAAKHVSPWHAAGGNLQRDHIYVLQALCTQAVAMEVAPLRFLITGLATLQVLLPCFKLFLSPPRQRACDGSVVLLTSMEKLYRVFERCM